MLTVKIDLDKYTARLCDLGLSHKDATEKAGLSGNAYKIMHGATVTPRTLHKLATALDVQPSSLLAK